jgi:hypothetical protein
MRGLYHLNGQLVTLLRILHCLIPYKARAGVIIDSIGSVARGMETKLLGTYYKCGFRADQGRPRRHLHLRLSCRKRLSSRKRLAKER